MLHVVEASYVDALRVRVRFNDGAEGLIDLSESLDGPVFEPLNDKSYFARFKIEGHTLSWPNGADFAPEYLRSLLSPRVKV